MVFLALGLFGLAPAQAQDTYFAEQDGSLPRQGAVAATTFTLGASRSLVLRVVADYGVDAGIFTPSDYAAFAAGQASSGWALFNNKFGTSSVTLAAGSYVVAIRNRVASANSFRYELDYDVTRTGERRLDSQTGAEYVAANGGRLWQPFTIGSGHFVWVDGANVGLEFFLIPAVELDNFRNGRTFQYYTDYLPSQSSNQPGGFHVNLPPGNYMLAFRNPASIPKPVTYTIEWWTGGATAPTTPITPTVTPPTITNQPQSRSVTAGASASFSVSASGTSLSYQWRRNGIAILGATSSTYTIASASTSDAGNYTVDVSNSAATVTSSSATLTVTAATTPTTPTVTAPSITSQPQSRSVTAGASASFSVTASGTSLSYQWRRNGIAISGATSSTYTIAATATSDAGNYTVDVSNSAATVTSSSATLTVTPGTTTPTTPTTPVAGAAARLVNLSIRTNAGVGAQTLIVGFVLGGEGTSGNKPLLVRGVGPTLGQFGVPGALVDPELQLFSGSAMIMSNNDWGGATALTNAFSQAGAFALPPTSRDAALMPTLGTGLFSAQISGSNGSGVALAEIYDLSAVSTATAALPRLVNISARAQAGSGADTLIAGFVVAGTGSKTILIRAIGPSLTQFGVPGALADPQLKLFQGSSLTSENNDWGGVAALSSAFTRVGAFGLAAGSRDAALLVTLQAGTYSAQVSGVGGATGVALIEVYEVP